MVNPTISKIQSTISSFMEYHDLTLQNEGVDISNTVYDPTTDRVYDVRTGSSVGANIQLINDSTSLSSVDFIIQSTNRAYSDLNDIPESDWEELQSETSVAVGVRSAQYETVRATPIITAIRIRLKVSSDSAKVFGRVGFF